MQLGGDFLRFSYKNIKFVFLIVLLVLLVILGYLVFFGNDVIDENQIINSRIKNDSLLFGLKINGVNCSYDSDTNTYYFSSSSGKINSVSIDSVYDTHYVLKESTDDLYRILIYTDDFYTYKFVKFTGVPIINISVFNGIPNYN